MHLNENVIGHGFDTKGTAKAKMVFNFLNLSAAMLMGGCISINENSFSINIKTLYFGINIRKPFLLL